MRAYSLLLLICTLIFTGCKKETELYVSENAHDYVALQPGRFITYRLDSTVTINFGNSLKVNSYQEKYTVDSAMTDNLGRPSFRVFRAIRDTAGNMPWVSQGSLFITATNNTLEVTENNLRFLKLATPIKQDFTWSGNQFLPTAPYSRTYEFSNDNGIDSWSYSYLAVDEDFVYKGITTPHVITVDQIDESTSWPVTNGLDYASINKSSEKYAKGIGMVYQELTMLEYQPPISPRPGYKGFGVIRNMIDHN